MANNNNTFTFRDAYKAIPTFDGKKPTVEVFVRACKRANDCLAEGEREKFFNMIPD